MKDAKLIEKDSHGLEDKIKKLKKIFKEQFKDAHKIKIYEPKNYPIIYFQYLEDLNSENPTQILLRDAIKKIKILRDKRPLL